MAKFCSQCGRRLEEGEVCNCTSQAVQGQPVQQEAVQTAQGQPVQPTASQAPQEQPVVNQPVQPIQGQYVNPQQVNANQMNKEVENVLTDLVSLVKQPVVTLAEFAKEKKGLLYGGCFVGINVIICTFISILYMLYLHSKVADYQMYLPDIPYVQIPILIFIFTAASAALLTTFLFLFDNKVFHGNATFSSMLAVVGAKAIVALVFIILGFVLGLLNTGVGLVFWIMSIVVAYAYMAISYSQVSVLDANKKAFVLMIVTIIMTVINCIFVRILFGIVMGSITDYFYTLKGLF